MNTTAIWSAFVLGLMLGGLAVWANWFMTGVWREFWWSVRLGRRWLHRKMWRRQQACRRYDALLDAAIADYEQRQMASEL